MARTVAELPKGSRITDFISLGVIAKTFPLDKIHRALDETGRASKRQRDLPAHVAVYYVIAMTLYMQVSCREVLRCLLEGMRWLMGPRAKIKTATRGGISLSRVRLGSQPIKLLHDRVVVPIAVNTSERTTKGAWHRKWRLVSVDGSTLDVADTKGNEAAFGRPGVSRGKSAFPQVRFVSLVENGTHVLSGTRVAGYDTSEIALAKQVIGSLSAGMLCLADRNFFSHEF